MKAKHLIYPSLAMALFLTFSLSVKAQSVYTKSQTAIANLAPDNMLAYFPETKNPDNMPIFRHKYRKVGSVDPMPNNYRSAKTGETITIRIKPDNSSSK